MKLRRVPSNHVRLVWLATVAVQVAVLIYPISTRQRALTAQSLTAFASPQESPPQKNRCADLRVSPVGIWPFSGCQAGVTYTMRAPVDWWPRSCATLIFLHGVCC